MVGDCLRLRISGKHYRATISLNGVNKPDKKAPTSIGEESVSNDAALSQNGIP